MKRKTLYSLFFICLLLIYFFTFNFFNSPESISTYKQYSAPSHRLSKELVNSYFNGNQNNIDEIKYNIKLTLLNNLGYEQWKEYIDYIELRMYLNNVNSSNSEQLVAVLNLSKDLATIVILEDTQNQYIYKDKLENISKVKNIAFLENKIFDRNLMLIYQEIDEYLGAFFYKEFLEIYVYKDNQFKNLWEQTIYFEETYKESWINPDDKSNKWNRVIEKTVIEFDFIDNSKFNTYTDQKKYIAYSIQQPNIKEYVLENSYSFNQCVYWSNKYNSFILGEVTKDRFLKDLALIKDMNNSIENLFGIKNNNLKVLSENGEVTYLNKNKFGNLFRNLSEQ
ncbi:hypothetical protein [Serpentinicella alkaliphila]|uniref:Uncharacterized protein n=1 Tax=Serpentinicella alkaliphila TaxID=1734049 RepID=A0A4R2TVY6_9FIRM|nr:hypothetical protein [Serpentinicella alkaliphila]QUH26936.1 hypothetical protein HZR23_15175 [Serpentinicella alkaliphila]TCQ08170.1 hypothetical protein EDD79_1001259 [Serpentinicella alkaliphila]